MTFRKFVNDQVVRLTAFEDFNRLADGGKKEYADLLFDLAKEPQPKRDRSAMDWTDSEPARNVKAVIDEGMEFQKHPTMHDIRSIWKRLVSAPAQAMRTECERCDGTGWISVDGPHGTSAAYHCTHQPETLADRRMGVRIHPSLARHYSQLDIEAAGRRALYVGSGGNINAEELKQLAAPVKRIPAAKAIPESRAAVEKLMEAM